MPSLCIRGLFSNYSCMMSSERKHPFTNLFLNSFKATFPRFSSTQMNIILVVWLVKQLQSFAETRITLHKGSCGSLRKSVHFITVKHSRRTQPTSASPSPLQECHSAILLLLPQKTKVPHYSGSTPGQLHLFTFFRECLSVCYFLPRKRAFRADKMVCKTSKTRQ